MTVAGIDGYAKGWVVLVLDDGSFVEAFRSKTFDGALGLLGSAETIGVDMPIGLPDSGRRPADVEAKRYLGARRSSVFLTPPRAALDEATREAASLVSKSRGGDGVTAQLWNLRDKILEVEPLALLDERVVEVHPEVSFRELAGRELRSKHTFAGFFERLACLESARIELPKALELPLLDVLDAAVAAWSARRYARGISEPLPTDATERIGAIWR